MARGGKVIEEEEEKKEASANNLEFGDMSFGQSLTN